MRQLITSWDKAILCKDWYVRYLNEEPTEDVMENLHLAWFPDSDVIRLVPDLTDLPFDPDNLIVKVATPDMAWNPFFVPSEVPTVPPPTQPVNMSDPWLVPKSTNFPKNFVVQNDVVYGISGTTPNELWNLLCQWAHTSGAVAQQLLWQGDPHRLTPKEISLDGWKNCHDLPWDQPFRYRDLECEATPTGPAGTHVFTHYVIWGLKQLLAETDYYKDFLVWDDQHRSWASSFRLPASHRHQHTRLLQFDMAQV